MCRLFGKKFHIRFFNHNHPEEIMKSIWRLFAVLPLFTLLGCAHSINITPPMNTLTKEGIVKIDKNAGYYISPENMQKEVTTPGGGGDSVKYVLYKESEPALKKVLSNIFNQVFEVPSPTDANFIASNKIFYIFTPEFTTDSSSPSPFTWPPTKFTMKIDCKATDGSGAVIWQTHVEDEGTAEYGEFKNDFSMAARRATQKAFLKLQDEILKSGKF
jgi:hypothetical protein